MWTGHQDVYGIPLRRCGFQPNQNHQSERICLESLEANCANQLIGDSGMQKVIVCFIVKTQIIFFADESYGSSPYSLFPPPQHPLE